MEEETKECQRKRRQGSLSGGCKAVMLVGEGRVDTKEWRRSWVGNGQSEAGVLVYPCYCYVCCEPFC